MDCPLVLIEWEDSAQPIPAWQHLAGLEIGGVIECASVGWLVRDDHVKALVPNMGAISDVENIQASGIITIPAGCVRRIVKLKEGRVISRAGPSSRPAKARKRRGS